MNILWLLLIVLFIATLNETLIEFLFADLIFKYLPKLNWTLKYIAVATAIGLAWAYRLDVIYMLASFVELDWQPFAQPQWWGILVTGIAVGKGSSYLHDLFKKYFVKPSTPSELPK